MAGYPSSVYVIVRDINIPMAAAIGAVAMAGSSR